MDIEALKIAVVAFVREHQAWAPLVVAALAFCELLAVISLFVPATVILLGIGGMIGGMGLSFWPIWAGAAIGAALGDWLSYEVGRYLEDSAHHVWPLRNHQSLIAKGEALHEEIRRLGDLSRPLLRAGARLRAARRRHFRDAADAVPDRQRHLGAPVGVPDARARNRVWDVAADVSRYCSDSFRSGL